MTAPAYIAEMRNGVAHWSCLSGEGFGTALTPVLNLCRAIRAAGCPDGPIECRGLRFRSVYRAAALTVSNMRFVKLTDRSGKEAAE